MTNALAGIQAIKDMMVLISTNWTAGNTDGITPSYGFNWEIDSGQIRIESFDLLIFDFTETIHPSLYALDWFHDIAMTIECFTSGYVPPSIPLPGSSTYSPAVNHLQNIGNEVTRIIKTNARQAGYAMTYLNGSRPMADDNGSRYHLFVDVVLKKINP